jgi:hypothetical protein
MSTLPYRIVHDGKAINATVNCLEVELTDPDHRSGTITLRLIGDDVAPAEAHGDYVNACDSLFKSIRIRPSAIARVNMGLVLASMKEYKNAEWHYKQSLRLNPGYLGAKWNPALLHLGMGNWEVGFEEHECRIKYRGEIQYPRLPYPMWNGEDLNGKTIFVQGEQGIGDRILFSRYLPWLKQAYPDCTIKHTTMLECQRLLWDYRKCVEFVDIDTPYRDIQADYAVFLMSLPRFLIMKIGNFIFK